MLSVWTPALMQVCLLNWISLYLSVSLAVSPFSLCSEVASDFPHCRHPPPLKKQQHPNRTIDFKFSFLESQLPFIISLMLFLYFLFLAQRHQRAKVHALLFRRGSEGFVIKRASPHLRLKRNSTSLRSTPHYLADV